MVSIHVFGAMARLQIASMRTVERAAGARIAPAHLDGVRRAALFDELLANPGQAWLTGTDRNLFDAFGARAQMFEVRDGLVNAG